MNEKPTPRRTTTKKKWERSTSTMKERKPFFEKKTNTKTMNRCEQVLVSRLRTGYTRMSFLHVEDNGRSHPMRLQSNRNKTATNQHH
jgi:hypothetical protein